MASQSRQPTEARRQQIAEAALTLLAEKGLRKFTTAAVAGMIGLSEGALFRHFGTKKEIVLSVIETIGERLFQSFPPTEGDALDQLGAFVRQRVDLLTRQPAIMRLIFSDQLAQASSVEGVTLVRSMQSRSFTFIRDRLFEAQAAGLLKNGLSPEHAAIIVHGSVFGASNRPGYEDLLSREVSRDIADQIWSTLDALIRR